MKKIIIAAFIALSFTSCGDHNSSADNKSYDSTATSRDGVGKDKNIPSTVNKDSTGLNNPVVDTTKEGAPANRR